MTTTPGGSDPDEEGYVAATYDDETGEYKGSADAAGKVDGYPFVHSSLDDAGHAAGLHDEENAGDITDIERPDRQH